MGLGGRMGVWDGGGRVVGIPCLDALRGCKKGCFHDEDGDSRGVDLVCRRVIMHPALGLVLPHLRRSDMVPVCCYLWHLLTCPRTSNRNVASNVSACQVHA